MFVVWHPEDGAEEFTDFREAWARWHLRKIGHGLPVVLYYTDEGGRIDIY